jgi:hypothetical protein
MTRALMEERAQKELAENQSKLLASGELNNQSRSKWFSKTTSNADQMKGD